MRYFVAIIAIFFLLSACRSEKKQVSSQPQAIANPGQALSTSVFGKAKLPPISPNTTNESFNKAKKHLNEIYSKRRQTFYCDCDYDENGLVDRKRCGYEPSSESIRAQRIEWEHVVPAHAFGQSFVVWREGDPECMSQGGKAFRGRPCARKLDRQYRFMESDMYNLYPVIGELNQRRANFSMGMVPGEPRIFGACDFEVQDRKVEPRPEIRGDIARTYLYMDLAYPGRGVLSKKDRKLFAAWDELDPVDVWECERARRIAAIQGNVNQVVETACRSAGL